MTPETITFRPGDSLAALIEKAEQITKRTKSSLVRECVEKRLPVLMGATKPRAKKFGKTTLPR